MTRARTGWPIVVAAISIAASCAAPQRRARVSSPASEVRRVPAHGAQDAAAAPAATPGERVYDLEALRIEVAGRSAAGEPELVAYDAQALLEAGNDALARGRPDEAIARYEKLVRAFPESRLIPAATYNLGLAHEARGEHDRAKRFLVVFLWRRHVFRPERPQRADSNRPS